MTAPSCQSEKGCTNEGFSNSTEHGNLWLCAKHYAEILPTLKANNVLKSISEMNPEDKATLLSLLGGKK